MRINQEIALVASGDMSLSMTHPSDCNVYLIDCGGTSILVDTGVGLSSDEIAVYIDNANMPLISYILITHHHADHTGGLLYMKKRYGSVITAPAEEADSIEQADVKAMGLDVAKKAGYYPHDYLFRGCAVDRRVKPGKRLQVGNQTIEVYSAAGHSSGGVCYYFPKMKTLFVGDLVLHGGLISLQNIPGANLEAYSNSVIGLETLEVEGFYPGHGCFSIKDGKRHILQAAKRFRSLGIPPNAV